MQAVRRSQRHDPSQRSGMVATVRAERVREHFLWCVWDGVRLLVNALLLCLLRQVSKQRTYFCLLPCGNG